jgi:hypothetical protein
MAVLVGGLFAASVSLIALSVRPDHDRLAIRQEDFMHQLLNRFRKWRTRVILAGTTFCETCSQVCTSACRREARLDRYHQIASRTGLFRF